MQSLFSLFAKFSPAPEIHAQKPASRAEIQELDAQQLQQVSGGLPKGGWGAPEDVGMDGESGLPKGGW